MAKICNVATPITSVNNITINKTKKCNTSNYTKLSSRSVSYLVFHYTGNIKDTASANANYFMTHSNVGASAHYFVDDTSIWQSVDINNRAWHCGTNKTYYHSDCRNNNSIAIEMCCTAGNYKIGNKAKENAAQLGAALCKYLGITDVDKYVLRHYDITYKNCPAQMAGLNNAEWISFKNRIKEILNYKPSPAVPKFTPYKVKVTADALNVRRGAGANYGKVYVIRNKGIYTIVDEITNGNTKWGLLKSYEKNRNGWISLSYTKRI